MPIGSIRPKEGAAAPPPATGVPDVTFETAFTTAPGAASPAWVSLTSRLLSAQTARGRQMELDQIETGAADALLNNQDRALDPANTASSYYPNVIPVRRTRIKATWSGTTYPLLEGDTVDWPQTWSGRINRVAVQVLDGFDALAESSFTATLPQQTSGARITAILDAVGFSATSRAIDPGQTTVIAKSYEDHQALDAIAEVVRSEQGMFFMAADGFATFYNRHRQWFSPFTTVQAVFSNEPAGGEYPYANAEPTYRRERIRNSVTIKNAAGTLFTAEDTASRTQYRKRSLSVDVITADDNECQALADYLLGLYKDAVLRVDAIVVEPQLDPTNLFPIVLGYEIGTRVQVKAVPPGSGTGTVDSVCSIQRVQHEVDGENRRWRTTWRLSPADTNAYWVLGVGALDAGTKLGY